MLRELIKSAEQAFIKTLLKNKLEEQFVLGRASARISHKRPYDFDEKLGTWLYKEIDEPEIVWNVITNSGRDFLHQQGYASSGIGANGLNYIGLSNDTLTETATSTVLSNEIVLNGLIRAQGVFAHTPGTNTSTIDKTFTCTTLPQAAQKAGLFSAVTVGTGCHFLAFTQRSLQVADTLQITYTITLG